MAKIRDLGTRKLSYAGRLVLIKAVLKTFHNYWASMFILPSGVIARIERICRNFLWDGGVDQMRNPLVSWDKVCKPTKEGGLGLKDDNIWNKAAIGKLVWWITSKSDHLWVKWASTIYIKDENWKNYLPPADSSWYWRKVCQVRDLLKDAYQQNEWPVQHGRGYTIAKGYEWLRNKGIPVQWDKFIWHKWTVPKHAFLVWMYQHGSLNTNAKLKRLGVVEDDTCLICGNAVENLDHLFLNCEYSKRVLQQIEIWLCHTLPVQNLMDWRGRLQGSRLKKGVMNAILNAALYHIWRQRNLSKFESKLLRP
ncbi:uncharacterized protein LOC141601971 [Silene latifolia]|uniref:uncharacterized protein LOC141601971 n=1 Tax=Silene latifolia TaxID=37657 RepID=UPI003D7769D4